MTDLLIRSGELDDLLIHSRTKATLRLADLQRYESGVLILTYEPVRRVTER